MVAVTYPLSTLIVASLAMSVGLGTFIKAVIEYRLQNRLKRFEKYLSMIRDFEANKGLQALREDIQKGGDALAVHDRNNKYMFMTFYQEIAMMVQSGLMRMDVAAYLVAFDAREVSLKQEAFIANLWGGTEDPNFALFWAFLRRVDEYVAPYYPARKKFAYPRAAYPADRSQVIGLQQWPTEKFRF